MGFVSVQAESARRERESRVLAATYSVKQLERMLSKLEKDRAKVKKDDVAFGECYDPLGYYSHRKFTLEDAIELATLSETKMKEGMKIQSDDFLARAERFRLERKQAWAEFLEISAEAGYTIEDNLANRSLFMGGYESGKEAKSA